MKKTIRTFAAVLTGFFSLFCLTSCMEILDILLYGDGSESSSYNIVTASQDDTWSYDSTRPIHMIDDSVKSLTIKNVPANKNMYLVYVNPNDYSIKRSDLRGMAVSASRSVTGVETLKELPETEVPESKYKNFVGEKIVFGNNDAVSRSVLSDVSEPLCSVSGTVGDEKWIYVDTNTSVNRFEQKKAHLRAKGDNCYVWVVDDYFSSTSSKNTVNTETAQKFADKFDRIYPFITNVFGTESDQLIDYDNSTNKNLVTLDMGSYSDTGKMVNIVIYDIGNDYNLSESSQCGVLGYFYSKDYIYSKISRTDIVGKSNKGKYFYLDSGYANEEPEKIISTLAHEFQHMINFNQKNIKHNLSPDTSYNEMLSMLCEDMMQDYLGLADKDSPKGRIKAFNIYYCMSGIREYLTDDNSALSYSTTYAFGSWLVRQYGGAKLVQAMSTNAYVDNESIVAAVNSVNSTSSRTFDDLFEEFLLAVTGLKNSHNSTYTHNKDALKDLSNTGEDLSGSSVTYYYPMTKFNLWDNDYYWGNTNAVNSFKDAKYTSYDYYGPFIFGTDAETGSYYAPSKLRPDWGMVIVGKGTTTAATSKTINFSSSGAEGLRIYVIIQ